MSSACGNLEICRKYKFETGICRGEYNSSMVIPAYSEICPKAQILILDRIATLLAEKPAAG